MKWIAMKLRSRAKSLSVLGSPLRQAPLLSLLGLSVVLPLEIAGQTPASQVYAFEPEPGPAENPPVDQRTVLELAIQRVGTDGPKRSIVLEVVNGPPSSDLRQDLSHDDLPLQLSFSAGILDPESKVAEIHFYQTDEGPAQGWIPFQKVLIDGDVETQVELARNVTLSLWWIELRDETIETVDGELVYRPVP